MQKQVTNPTSRYIDIKCPNGHQADKLCIRKNCSSSSPICKQVSCKYHEVHKKCRLKTDIKEIQQMFDEKINVSVKETDLIVLESINKMIEELELLRNEYLEKGREEMGLVGENKTIFEMMKSGEMGEIKPEAVIYCVDRMHSQQNIDEQKTMEAIKSTVTRLLDSHSRGLQEIRAFWNNKKRKPKGNFATQEKFTFDSELCNKDYCSILDNGSRIRKTKKQGYTFAIVTQSLFQASKNEIILTINRMSCVICVGIVSKQQILKSDFKRPWENKGIYCISHKGFMFNQRDSSAHRQTCELKFRQKDMLSLSYFQDKLQQSYKLRIKNISTNKIHTLCNLPSNLQDLHFGVYLWGKNDEISITDW